MNHMSPGVRILSPSKFQLDIGKVNFNQDDEANKIYLKRQQVDDLIFAKNESFISEKLGKNFSSKESHKKTHMEDYNHHDRVIDVLKSGYQDTLNIAPQLNNARSPSKDTRFPPA
jgi:hypothetical protein